MTFSDILGLVGIGIGVVGFGAALYQLRLAKQQITRAVTAAEAAEAAVAHTERLRALVELMGAIPLMQRLERDLGIAARDKNRDASTNHLRDWRKLVAETRGLLSKQPYDSHSLENRLQESSAAAAQALSLLEDTDVPTATKWVNTMISSATEEATVLMGQLKAHPQIDTVGNGL